MSRELKQSDRTALEDLEFPSHLPEDQCIRAVLEVRDYILSHEGGSKERIWSDIVLDTDRPSSGREVCKHWGYVPKFRDEWWEYVILPGLRILSDIEPEDQEESNWQPYSE
jgi:hypothetical protein